MKFPRELSKERIFLLSPEDKEIYYKEHPNSQVGKNKFIIRECVEDDEPVVSEEFEDDPLDKMLDEQMMLVEQDIQNSTVVEDFVDNVITEEVSDMIIEFDALFEQYSDLFKEKNIELDENRWDVIDECRKMLTEEEFMIEESDDYGLLLEGAEGYDCGEWIKGLVPKVGWLGKWIGAGLGALGLGLGYLWTIGKDRLAMARLKKYMNRLVELTDQGVHKKRPWYSYLTWGETRKNLGEYNNGCFRSIQEAADRNMCVVVMVAAQKLGYFNVGEMMNISSGGYPQPGGGIKAFETNLADRLNIAITH